MAEFDELVGHAAAGNRRAIRAIAIAFGPKKKRGRPEAPPFPKDFIPKAGERPVSACPGAAARVFS